MKIISFTISQNEPLFEPLWRNYYSKVGDIIVFDPRKEPGLPSQLGNKDTEKQQVIFVNETIKRFLREGYDIVIYPDVDEFLIPNNGQGNIHQYSNLKLFCETFKCDYAKANGYQIVHQPNTESSVNWPDPLHNRSVCYKSNYYCKTLITKIPLINAIGRHSTFIESTKYLLDNDTPNPNLDLVHLKFVDFDLDYNRWYERGSRCPSMTKLTRDEFKDMYNTGTLLDKFRYWEGDALPLKYHWRNALKISD